MAEVKLTQVNKRYGNIHAVHDVDLTVADEEFVVLVGPSGCGKSTTLRMVAGLEEISGGTIDIGGRVVNDLPPRDRDIAMVFQNYALYQHMTVYDNLAFGLRNRKVPEADIRKEIDRAASILGIQPLMARKPKQLSGGQQQRVALGRCIVRNPAVFLFDEPLSNLDAKLRAQMRIELKELRTRVATTSIYVTHDQVEAMTLGDRIVVMKDGLVQQIGTPLELYRTPANRFVGSFLGSPAMNFVDVTVVQKNGGLVLSDFGADIVLPDAMAAALAGHVGKNVVIGLRPEHILMGEGSSEGTIRLDGSIVLTEQLGAQQLVELRVGERTVMAAGVDPDLRLQGGDAGRFSIALDRVHVFAAGDSGPVLWSAGKGQVTAPLRHVS
ncbi:MAG: sn-glycerol-3-phosphate ABC transporter ATP-binding protein UgpC [Alphaproteobacteria bacterium]|nr:sn-glycerol-3-phosphate ABC transporter ATP-binding protein UgpC [Alphaproteobacteria bacterium]MBU0799342.1 sn-glycerol-3-phosphate ABC transporter ATP-binding protein UgpC [Alphaproteobacteria bacterium]MBU1812873.1 sn-glycerol-3-phosphate ABC transporter ATP-binding protein UgpC [Alphaproteobacteria bacterium]